MSSFRCATCGEMHEIGNLTLGAEAPDHWDKVQHAGAEGCELSSDQCMIHETDFFIRGCLDIPIEGSEDSFRWGVWTTLSEANFLQISELWDDPERTKLGPHFGWLSTRIPGYAETVNLKCMVHHQAPGIRPMVEILEQDHLLSEHYRQGVPINFLMPILHPYFSRDYSRSGEGGDPESFV